MCSEWTLDLYLISYMMYTLLYNYVHVCVDFVNAIYELLYM